MTRQAWLLAIVLCGSLGAAIWLVVGFWRSMDETAGGAAGAISGHGMVALILGGLGTVLIAVVLMGLLFYSNRKNFDQ